VLRLDGGTRKRTLENGISIKYCMWLKKDGKRSDAAEITSASWNSQRAEYVELMQRPNV
jgi:hypothetical protein